MKYRNENGPFCIKEDLKNVITDHAYRHIESLICVERKRTNSDRDDGAKELASRRKGNQRQM